MPPTYYRGCWHVVSRDLFLRYRPYSSPRKAVYNPKAFFPHAASLHQAFAHCARFLTAAARRRRDRVSVPVWGATLSRPLPVVGLVGRYPTNYLIGRRPILKHQGFALSSSCGFSDRFQPLSPTSGQVPTCYRGCWHVVSRHLFLRYRPSSSRRKGLYDPKTFIVHAASLRQAFAHCAIFLTAASRRSLGRVSVPVWGITLSGPLPVVALVGRYPTN